MDPRRRPFTWLVVSGALGLWLLRHFWPLWSGKVPPCAVHHWTGLHCPGCGGTRCAGRLLEGDLAGALAMNAAVTLVALAGAGVLLAGLRREWRGDARRAVFPPALAWVLALFVVIFGLTRNLPWWPFTLLAPH
jgi:hypothetical protein